MAAVTQDQVQELVDAIIGAGITEVADVPVGAFEIINAFAEQYGQAAALTKQREDEAKGAGEAAYYNLLALRPLLYALNPDDPDLASVESTLTWLAARWSADLPQTLPDLPEVQASPEDTENV